MSSDDIRMRDMIKEISLATAMSLEQAVINGGPSNQWPFAQKLREGTDPETVNMLRDIGLTIACSMCRGSGLWTWSKGPAQTCAYCNGIGVLERT